MKSRVVFSLYIDIPKEDLDWQPPHHGHTIPKTEHTKQEFQKYAPWLKQQHVDYCESIGIEYKFFEYDQAYIDYRDWFLAEYPQITHYNIVNFYKIHLLYELSKEYDEVLYLDFDVVPVTTDNFFEAFDLSKGIVIMEGMAPSQSPFARTIKQFGERRFRFLPSIRSPAAKWWNCKAMCMMEGLPCDNEDVMIFNTGIIGATREHLEQLDYFGDFDYTLSLMDDLKNNADGMWMDPILKLFGWDNETIWGYKTALNEVEWQLIGPQWHHFMDKENKIPEDTKFIHTINKNFDFVQEWIEENVAR